MLRLYRSNTKSVLTIAFSDVGVNFSMSDAAIESHVRAFYPEWVVMMAEQNNEIRAFEGIFE